MGEREAALWRSAVTDPCGCAEGLAGAVTLSVAGALVGPVSVGVLAGAGIGLVVGAATGKVFGVARGLRVARAQRQQLRNRAAELEVAATRVGGTG